jgi:hypothetical protein
MPSVLSVYTPREYVGLECTWLEALTCLVLLIALLVLCCEQGKLRENYGAVVGAWFVVALGAACAVLIRLPCVPISPDGALGALDAHLTQALPLTLLSLVSVGACAAVFLAGAGADRGLSLLFTCALGAAASLTASSVRALVAHTAPYELLTLVVPQWLCLLFLSFIMKHKTFWARGCAGCASMPTFALLLLLLHTPPLLATLLCLPSTVFADRITSEVGITQTTLFSYATVIALSCGALAAIASICGLDARPPTPPSDWEKEGGAGPPPPTAALLDAPAKRTRESGTVRALKTFALGWIALSMVRSSRPPTRPSLQARPARSLPPRPPATPSIPLCRCRPSSPSSHSRARCAPRSTSSSAVCRSSRGPTSTTW